MERERRAGRAGERTHRAATHEARRLRERRASGRQSAGRPVARRLVAHHWARSLAGRVGEDGLRDSVRLHFSGASSSVVARAVSAWSRGRRRQQPTRR